MHRPVMLGRSVDQTLMRVRAARNLGHSVINLGRNLKRWVGTCRDGKNYERWDGTCICIFEQLVLGSDRSSSS